MWIGSTVWVGKWLVIAVAGLVIAVVVLWVFGAVGSWGWFWGLWGVGYSWISVGVVSLRGGLGSVGVVAELGLSVDDCDSLKCSVTWVIGVIGVAVVAEVDWD